MGKVRIRQQTEVSSNIRLLIVKDGEPHRNTKWKEAFHTEQRHYKCTEYGGNFNHSRYLFSTRECTLGKSLINMVNEGII